MITAIVIPIIFLYFFLLTKRELRENHNNWLRLKEVPEEAVISGKIIQYSWEKQRFYYNHYIYLLHLTIETDVKQLQVIKKIPIENGVQLPDLKNGDYVRLYGNWTEDVFQVNRIEGQP